MADDQQKWNARYRAMPEGVPQPCEVLRRYAYLLPDAGQALDLAAGRGGNALHLARHGLHTTAWDIADVAVTQLEKLANSEGVTVEAQCRDVIAEPPGADTYDIIVVSRFLHRPLCARLIAALRPSGLLYYQTYTNRHLPGNPGPRNPAHLLQANELLSLFASLQVRAYQEDGQNNEAWLVAQRINSPNVS